MSSTISPAGLEGRAALNQEAAGTKAPLRVQHGVAAALFDPCLSPLHCFIVPLGFSFYCFSQHHSGNQTQGFAAGKKVLEQQGGVWGRMGGSGGGL